MIDQFLQWEKQVRPEIEKVSSLLAEELSDEPMKLIEDLITAEAYNSRIGSLLARADYFLDRFTLEAMPSREGRLEADRKALLDSETAPIRMVRDTLENLCDVIKQRLILGESILSYYKSQYADHKPMEKPF